MFNWAVEEGYIRQSPIRKLRRKRRDIFYTDGQWQQIKELAPPPFDDLLDFLYITGCRPGEARAMSGVAAAAGLLPGDLISAMDNDSENRLYESDSRINSVDNCESSDVFPKSSVAVATNEPNG